MLPNRWKFATNAHIQLVLNVTHQRTSNLETTPPRLHLGVAIADCMQLSASPRVSPGPIQMPCCYLKTTADWASVDRLSSTPSIERKGRNIVGDSPCRVREVALKEAKLIPHKVRQAKEQVFEATNGMNDFRLVPLFSRHCDQPIVDVIAEWQLVHWTVE